MPPHENYGDKVFTVGPVGYPGLKALSTSENAAPDYTPLIETALALPRQMDVGQCNDAYSAIQIALGLAQAFDPEVNELPLSMILSLVRTKGCGGVTHPASFGH